MFLPLAHLVKLEFGTLKIDKNYLELKFLI